MNYLNISEEGIVISILDIKCSCLTKTHEIEHHKTDCKYRLFIEEYDRLHEGNDDLIIHKILWWVNKEIKND